MKNIGQMEASRLINIPAKNQAAHEFCFHLHDLMVSLLVEMEVERAATVRIKVETEEDISLLEKGINIFDFLSKTGRTETERRMIVNHVTGALYADMLHFIYEGLIALEKRKFSVAFTLLRKPFKEGLLIAAQMCADEVAFFDRMKTDASNLLNRKEYDEDGIKRLIQNALKGCRGDKFANPEAIYSSVFDRKNSLGLGALFDKATHLITEFSQIKTENYNINFIFKNPEDNDVYELIYNQLAMLLVFLNIMQIELYSRMEFSKENYRRWNLLTTVGAYEALFTPGMSKIVGFVNKHFGTFMSCPHCKAQIRIRKTDGPRLYIGEILDCRECGMSHHFPFAWLLAKLEMDNIDDPF